MTNPEPKDIIKRVDGNTEEMGYVIAITPEGILVEFLGKSPRKGTPGLWRGAWEKVPDVPEQFEPQFND